MNPKIEQMNYYFGHQIALCRQQEKVLIEDDRVDEANFQKIKSNIYDVFRTILSVAQKTGDESPDAVKRFFLTKTEQIPSNWKTAYEAAKQHEDTAKMMVEQIKLDTVQEIRTHFCACWEDVE